MNNRCKVFFLTISLVFFTYGCSKKEPGDNKSVDILSNERALNQSPSEILQVPIIGRWSIKGTPGYHYIFTEEKGHGVLRAGNKDGIFTTLDFEAIDPDMIRIQDGKGDGFAGDWFTAEEIVKIILLLNPPETLRFSGEQNILQMHGLFTNNPVTLIRSGE